MFVNSFFKTEMIEIVQSAKKKLFCCFIDFKQASDSMSRYC